MKLCKDCKYFSNPLQINSGNEPYCLHREAQTQDDPIWGNHSKRTCKEMRSNGSYCSITGMLWVAAAHFTPTEYNNG